jgi:hypothetical protein
VNTKIDPKIDTTKCPLCGGPNQCALAADPTATECWCDDKKFPRELLEKIPAKAVRRACICPKCLERYQATGGVIEPPK